MRRTVPVMMLIALCAAVPGCTNLRTASNENMLVNAGFHEVPANTPKRVAMLQRLPPRQMLHAKQNNVMLYAYADPTVCNCLYVGDQAALDRYRSRVAFNQAQFDAETNGERWEEWQ